MKILILLTIGLLGLLGLLGFTPIYSVNADFNTITDTKLRLNQISPVTFNEGQPIVFSGKLTTLSGEPIPKVEIIIKSDATCPSDGIIAKGMTDKHGRFWIYTLTKIWDPVDNMINAYAEFEGNEKFSSSISRHEVIVVFPVAGESC